MGIQKQQFPGTLSGDTEVAIARDTFKGMLETLSRTKESIRSASRHAIDCAKYSLAAEVILKYVIFEYGKEAAHFYFFVLWFF